MPISGGKYVAPTWVNGSGQEIDADEMQAISDTLAANQTPPNHADAGTTYGIGNASKYGHLKLSDTPNASLGQTSGVAATPKSVQAVASAAAIAQNTANSAQNEAATKGHAAVHGNYVGNGNCGVNGKNSLGFSVTGVPAAILILAGNNSGRTSSAILFPNSGNGRNIYANAVLYVSISGSTVYWYATQSAADQLNENGVAYYYVALY